MRTSSSLTVLLVVHLLLFVASPARADEAAAPPGYPPPQYAYPPPQYAYPPPQYAYPPPQYAYPPQPLYAPRPLSPDEDAYRQRRRAKAALYASGGAILGVSYLSMMFTGVVCASFGSTNPCSSWSFLPIGGPFYMASYESAHHDPPGAIGLALVGVMQLTGLGLVIAGAALPAHKRENVSLAPMVLRDGSGLALAARF